MARVAYGILGALTVLTIHSAAWGQQLPAPGPSEPGAVANPGFPAPTAPPAAPTAPSAAPTGPSAAPAPAYPPGAYGPQPAPSPYPPPGYSAPPPQGYAPPPQGYSPPPQGYSSPYPPSYPPPPPPYRPYGSQYGSPYGRPYGYGYAAPRPYYPSAPYANARSVWDRPFELRLGLGAAWLRYTDRQEQRIQDEPGINFNIQLGFGLAQRLVLLFGVDTVMTGGSSDNLTYQQTAVTAGLQVFLAQRLYLRGGVGFGARTASDEFDTWTDSSYGLALLAGVGIELVQGYHWALYTEWTLLATRFTVEPGKGWWYSNSVGFGIAFF